LPGFVENIAGRILHRDLFYRIFDLLAVGALSMSRLTSDLETQGSQTAESIQDWLVEQVSQRLDLDPDEIDSHASFESFGMESSEALVLLNTLEQWLGRSVPPVLLWNYPTIAQLSERLAEGDDENE
jgi:acyl carrier protein